MTAPTLADDAIRKLGHDVFSRRIPFNEVIGLKLDFSDLDRMTLRFGMKEDLVGNFVHGILHGGVTAAALDVVSGTAVFTNKAREMPANVEFETTAAWFSKLATIDLRVDFLRPGAGQEFTATARVIRAGRRIAFVQSDLHNERGDHIATGSGSYTLASVDLLGGGASAD